MSGESSNVDEPLRLKPVQLPEQHPRRPDDPRLGEITQFWDGGAIGILPGQAALVGFPVDEGVRRNHGRHGAAGAPNAIRRWLYRMTTCDCQAGVDLTDRPLVDLGNIQTTEDLESAQEALGKVVAAILASGGIPIVLGGGHETAYGHFLGYVGAKKQVGIINIDAHLDVRPNSDGLGHSGSPFRQALEHATQPLAGDHYVCLGAQPHSVSHAHWRYVLERGGQVRWCGEVRHALAEHFSKEQERLTAAGCQVYVTMDADAVRAADVTGVSAPNPSGLPGQALIDCARLAGSSRSVSSLDVVEINPRFDHDDQSTRWAALVVWNFLMGLTLRN